MNIQYYRKNVYGNELIYLIDSPQAESILRLIGQKTISERQIGYFESLGLIFEEVIAPRELKIVGNHYK